MLYSFVLFAIFVNFSFAADISILTDTSLVETGEVNNVKAVIDQPFDEISKFNSGDFCNIVTDKKIIIIPELTNLNDLLAKRNFGAACSPHDISIAEKLILMTKLVLMILLVMQVILLFWVPIGNFKTMM